MVYNAMKLFMEVNPTLFDDCSQEYAEASNSAEQRKQTRASKWERLADMAKAKQNGRVVDKLLPITTGQGQKVNAPLGAERSDDVTAKLQDLGIQDTSPPAVPGR